MQGYSGESSRVGISSIFLTNLDGRVGLGLGPTERTNALNASKGSSSFSAVGFGAILAGRRPPEAITAPDCVRAGGTRWKRRIAPCMARERWEPGTAATIGAQRTCKQRFRAMAARVWALAALAFLLVPFASPSSIQSRVFS